MGVPQDYGQALQWLRRAAEQEVAMAQHDLGSLYANGEGVPRDYTQAYLWFNLAAARMPPGPLRDTAVNNRGLVTAYLTPAQLVYAQALARVWQPKPETPGERPLCAPAP